MLAANRSGDHDVSHRLKVATAALMFEVMRTDGKLKAVEREAMEKAIAERFGLSVEETQELARLAQAEAETATDYYQFTSLIHEHYTPQQKLQVVEQMWAIAAADTHIDRFERSLVFKVADLLHVPRPAQLAARERALRAARKA